MPIIANRTCWRAELTIGTHAGYGPIEVVDPSLLIEHIEVYQQRPGPWYAGIVWPGGTVVGPTFPSEPVIRVVIESNPLYTPDATSDDVTRYATDLAEYLAAEFEQVRIYIAVYPVTSLIVEQPTDFR